ncbi:MAG: hypothetical protein AB7I06_18825 [Burkholderiales bacterium]
MTTLDIKLTLPEPLAAEVERMGLLEPDNLRALLADAVRTRRLARLAEARARIAASGGEPMSLEEIAAEVAADRAERRKAAHG